jgi:hypothetical protein
MACIYSNTFSRLNIPESNRFVALKEVNTCYERMKYIPGSCGNIIAIWMEIHTIHIRKMPRKNSKRINSLSAP